MSIYIQDRLESCRNNQHWL